MAELALHSDSVSDIARALVRDRVDGAATEVLAWAESLRGCIRSHQREIELLLPWAVLVVNEATPTPRSAQSASIFGDQAFEDLFLSMPTLATLPDRCEQATSILLHRRMELAANPAESGDSLARIERCSGRLQVRRAEQDRSSVV